MISESPLILPGSVAAGAQLRLPPGTAPSAPVSGDVWTTAAGLFVRIGTATIGPLFIPTATRLQATAASAVLAAANSTWYDAGCGLVLPDAGTYFFSATIRSWVAQSAPGGTLLARLYNTSTGAAIANSETRLAYAGVASTDYLTTTTINMLVTTTVAGQTVRPEISRTATGTYSAAQTQTDANGRTRSLAFRIA
ncbi:hypothetical protein ACQQ2N_12075 [Dokdonella sp. MW10]|uniref:hypothetical protein n=1 Tax=Dokdonella sp. MW10 TaxID=2992926 RepID=UPI003F801690